MSRSTSRASKRRSEGEMEPAEQLRRSRGPPQRAFAADAAAPSPPAATAAAAAPAAGGAPCPAIPTAAHQALLRFLTANGRVTRAQVEEFFDDTKMHCSGAHSKVLVLNDAWDHLNQFIRFMELEIRRIKSEVDDTEYWCLVDNTNRVAQANASFLAVDAGEEDGEERKSAPAASAASSRAAGKAMDASAIAKYLNPSQFTDKQIAYFKTLLDAILSSPGGQLSVSEARSLRTKVSSEKRAQLSSDGEVEACLHLLAQQGWIRDNPNEKKVANSQPICLAERTYAELRAYVEDKCKTECVVCRQPCLLGLTCLGQSTASKERSQLLDLAAASSCAAKMHYHCAERTFLHRHRSQCPTCACTWDRYLKSHGAPVLAASASP